MHDVLAPLPIALFQPSLPRLRPSAPQTPRTPSSHSHSLFPFATTNRNSTDSWTSSNGADDIDYEWKPEQIRLLSRTLDALPPHLATPFNGPTPPSNLLDKIAHGIANAKGPLDWPHSIRATRVKLIELSRSRAKENQPLVSDAYTDLHTTHTNGHLRTPHPIHGKSQHPPATSNKRPLYRQSSMDFISADELKKEKTVNDIAPLADRLNEHFSADIYHPYSRRSRATAHCTPPSCSALTFKTNTTLDSLISPIGTTTSSTTLNTLSSFSSRHNRFSTASSTSASSFMSVQSGPPAFTTKLKVTTPAAVPCIQRVPLSGMDLDSPLPKDSCTKKESPVPKAGMKRPPSFGILAQDMKRDRDRGHLNKDKEYHVSSDEEEKLRTMSAKKKRVKDTPAAVVSPPASSIPVLKKSNQLKRLMDVDMAPPNNVNQDSRSPKPRKNIAEPPIPKSAPKKPYPPPMNPRRNPSMFGPELPQLQVTPPPPAAVKPPVIAASAYLGACLESSPSTPPKAKTLRRVRRLAPGRRISFGSLARNGEDHDADAEGDSGCEENRHGLESAFQPY